MLPREHFLARAELVDVRLSPDGSRVSFLRRSERGAELVLQDVATGAQQRVAWGLQRAQTAWSGDGRRLWLADDQGLAVVEASTLVARRAYKWDSRRSQSLWMVDARAPGVAVIHEKVDGRHRYLAVNAAGTARLLLDAALPLRSALLYANGELAYTAAWDGPRYETAIRQHQDGKARELMRCAGIEECRLVGFSEAQRAVWVLSQHGEDKLALRRFSSGSGKWETIQRDPAAMADADEILWSAERENWTAISFHDGRRRWVGNDSTDRAVVAALERRLPAANLQLSASRDGTLLLVRAQEADVAIDRYYLYRPDRGQLVPLFAREHATTRAPALGAAMHPVAYRARDGMLLHGYVLLPSGVDAATAPLVAWLHGGPVTRTYDQYEGSMQLLVNRGYAVFVPNFRVSTGYGLSYVLAAKGDVGDGRVLSDLVDGMDFLLAEGIGDRARQAVMGMSFGGYASLLAITHHPARFRFAFAGAPPTDYGWIKQWQAEHDSDALHPEGAPLSLQFPQLGFPYRDAAWRAKMARESPLAGVRSLEAPAYVWAGERDDHVPLASIVKYVSEVRRAGKAVSVLIDPEGGHGPTTPLGTEASLYMIELAAHRHLGGGLAPASPDLQAFMQRNLRFDMAHQLPIAR
ncbi:MAG: peptidase prolyl oligopeptidase active site domain protein [Gemmatimonadetes bacterium]|nr:peptidase prolyl oligopeptidase active site domain protein [Gemmatimonadota bacterium]